MSRIGQWKVYMPSHTKPMSYEDLAYYSYIQRWKMKVAFGVAYDSDMEKLKRKSCLLINMYGKQLELRLQKCRGYKSLDGISAVMILFRILLLDHKTTYGASLELRRLVLAAAVYFIWQDRDYRILEMKVSWDVIYAQIIDTIKLKLMSSKAKPNKAALHVAKLWNVHMNIQ
ncbi:hypothetical protein Tco_0834403 [Tanacetum coccineum]